MRARALRDDEEKGRMPRRKDAQDSSDKVKRAFPPNVCCTRWKEIKQTTPAYVDPFQVRHTSARFSTLLPQLAAIDSHCQWCSLPNPSTNYATKSLYQILP